MIAVCVPTYRFELYSKTFLPAWRKLFQKHEVLLLTSIDDAKRENIKLQVGETTTYTIDQIMGDDARLVFPRNAGTKLLSFYFIARNVPDVEYVMCLDDDVVPVGDPIQDHLDALNMKVPVSWMGIADIYTRGVPYGIRDEAEVVLSHGVWDGVPDIDAPTQLVIGDKPKINYYRMPIPKGVYYPMSEMNIAFKRKLLPYMYFAPTTMDFYGADDIWAGIQSKRAIDEHNWAAVTGYSRVYHERASNKFEILIKQGKFIKYNETYWKEEPKEPYFDLYRRYRNRWEMVMMEML